MNVSSNQQALVLADPSVQARGNPYTERTPAQAAAGEGELRKRVTVLAAPSEATVVVVRADYFSRTDAKERAFIDAASYGDARTPRRGADSASSSVVRQFKARISNAASSRPSPAALYARIQGSAADTQMGLHVDVFA